MTMLLLNVRSRVPRQRTASTTPMCSPERMTSPTSKLSSRCSAMPAKRLPSVSCSASPRTAATTVPVARKAVTFVSKMDESRPGDEDRRRARSRRSRAAAAARARCARRDEDVEGQQVDRADDEERQRDADQEEHDARRAIAIELARVEARRGLLLDRPVQPPNDAPKKSGTTRRAPRVHGALLLRARARSARARARRR